MDMPQQPGQPAPYAEGAEEGAAGGTKICLAVGPGGELSVYMEKDGAEMERQSVPDIGGAFRAILDLYKQVAASTGADGSQEFDDGFGARKPAPAAMPGMRGA